MTTGLSDKRKNRHKTARSSPRFHHISRVGDRPAEPPLTAGPRNLTESRAVRAVDEWGSDRYLWGASPIIANWFDKCETHSEWQTRTETKRHTTRWRDTCLILLSMTYSPLTPPKETHLGVCRKDSPSTNLTNRRILLILFVHVVIK